MTTYNIKLEDHYIIKCRNKIKEVTDSDEISLNVKEFLIKSVYEDEIKHIRKYIYSKYVLHEGDILIVNDHVFRN